MQESNTPTQIGSEHRCACVAYSVLVGEEGLLSVRLDVLGNVVFVILGPHGHAPLCTDERGFNRRRSLCDSWMGIEG
eukprot:12624967-Alexandrium_andersonii.AAC.1